jgi:hypothetical protein
MKVKRYEFRLSEEQWHYLRRTLSERKRFVSFPFQNEPAGGSCIVVQLTRDEALQLTQELTEELARVGFDRNYALTPQGCVIEELIDKFFLCDD